MLQDDPYSETDQIHICMQTTCVSRVLVQVPVVKNNILLCLSAPPHPPPEGYLHENWVEVCGSLPKTLTLLVTKVCDILYPIYDLTKYLKPCF